MGRLPVFRFDPAKVLVIPTPGGPVPLMERDHRSPEIGVVNWISDAQYVEQIVRAALAGEGDEQRALACMLLSNAEKLSRLLSTGGKPDPKIAHEILKSRRLGELLTSKPALVSEFMAALRRDPDIASRIEQEIEWLTKAAVEAKRAEITAELTASLEAEFATVRRERKGKLEAELADLEASSLQELQDKIDSQRNAALSDIEVRKLGLEKAVAELENSRDELHESHRLQADEIEALSTEVAKLNSEVEGRKSDVDRLLRMERILQDAGDRSTKADGGPSIPLPDAKRTARPLRIDEISEWLKTCPMLTETGKRGVAKLSALILSGSVPVVAGPEADDVLEVISSMLAGGATTIFDCDPTIITYEDLWRRPGGEVLTPLGSALSNVHETTKVRLCAIRHAELSPSQFWIETLRRASKQGSLPRGLLLCVSRADDGSDDGAKDRSVVFPQGWIERDAGAQALALAEDDGFDRVVDVAELPFDRVAALSAIGTSQGAHLSIAEARWLARFAPVAKAVLKADAGPFVKEILEFISANPKPDLKLIDARGPSRA
jgi:hypothetical protein